MNLVYLFDGSGFELLSGYNHFGYVAGFIEVINPATIPSPVVSRVLLDMFEGFELGCEIGRTLSSVRRKTES